MRTGQQPPTHCRLLVSTSAVFRPDRNSVQSLPAPARTAAPTRFAVLRFSGLARPDDVQSNTRELLAQVTSHGLHAIGPVSLAQYNPPWTLRFMRRNEVMVEVAR